jgi:arylsulfatase A-like enzyme
VKRCRGADAATQRALDVLTSSRLLDALDVSKEPEKVRNRYGDGKPYQYQFDGAPTANDHLLMARRLVEAGARCVTLSFGRWDSHGKNFDLVRDHGGKLDQCITALVEDLEVRGMLDDVTVIAWGEFGRTPRINNQAGRDHWPQVSCALLAGGGMKTGQVIGSTDRLGEHAKERPVSFADIFATIWNNLGIDPETTTINDPKRPAAASHRGRNGDQGIGIVSISSTTDVVERKGARSEINSCAKNVPRARHHTDLGGMRSIKDRWSDQSGSSGTAD